MTKTLLAVIAALTLALPAQAQYFPPGGGGGGGSGTVTSVGMTGDGAVFNSSVTGSPVSVSGTFAPSLLTQTSHTFFGVPGGSTSAPSFMTSAQAAAALPLATTSAQGLLPVLSGVSTQFLNGSGSFSAPAGGGSVTSVALTMPSWLTVGGSPITTSGTLAVTGASQSANLVVASPNGSAGAVAPRALVAADLPSVPLTGLATQAAGTIVGNGTGGTASPTALTGAQAAAILPAFSNSAAGLVPAGGAGSTSVFLNGAGAFSTPSGSGGGTVNSVAMTGDGTVFNSVVTGSPVTNTGTLAPALLTQSSHTFFGVPGGSTAAPSFMTAAQAAAALPLATTSAQGLLPTLSGVGTQFLNGNGSFSSPAGSGTVTSAAMTGDGTIFNSSVTGSPITTSGTFAPSLISQTANTGLFAPNGTTGAPTFRALVAADLPAIPLTGLATQAADTFVGNGTGGTASPTALTAAQVAAILPLATTSAQGMLPTLSGVSTQFLNGNGTYSTPAGGAVTVNTAAVGDFAKYTASSTISGVTVVQAQNTLFPWATELNGATAESTSFSAASSTAYKCTGTLTMTLPAPSGGGPITVFSDTTASITVNTSSGTVGGKASGSLVISSTSSAQAFYIFFDDGTNFHYVVGN